MDFHLNEKSVRAMADRLRTFLRTNPQLGGAAECSLAMSLEATAKMLGHRNWDTLIGLLRKEAAGAASVAGSPRPAQLEVQRKAPTIDKPFLLVWEAYPSCDFGHGPGWAIVEVNQSFIDTLCRVLAQKPQQSRRQAPLSGCDVDWDPDYRDQLMVSNELVVQGQSYFWLSARPKYADYDIETRMLDIHEFFDIIEQGQAAGSPGLAWADGVLFRDGSSARELAIRVAEAGGLGEAFNEGCIDEMP